MCEFQSCSSIWIASDRLKKLANAAIVRCEMARDNELEPFEDKIAKEMARRSAVTRRWFRPDPDREAVIRDLCRKDYVWSLEYMFAKESNKGRQATAERLLLATEESFSVSVSVDDLWVIST
jgi:hypothetical protein